MPRAFAKHWLRAHTVAMALRAITGCWSQRAAAVSGSQADMLCPASLHLQGHTHHNPSVLHMWEHSYSKGQSDCVGLMKSTTHMGRDLHNWLAGRCLLGG